MRLFRLSASLMLCVCAPFGASAQTVETVVVTAAPPDPVGNDAFSVVHMDTRELRASPELDIALEQVPGLSLFRRDTSLSANPTTQGVSLRSIAPSGAGRALVTLDGVPQNDPFGGWVIWSALPPEDISTAEIVRGAGAGPYGAGALTGVIALGEAYGTGLAAGDLSGGSLGERRTAASGGSSIGAVALFASASAESSDGWIPVASSQRGAADDDVTLDARNASLRAEMEPVDGTLVSARMSAYEERRNSGVVGTVSSASGETASLTIAHPESEGALGWRVQAWLRDTGFTNSSASIAAGRATATPSNDQYATPAQGWGTNAALRGAASWFDWEVGADARVADGESREHFTFVSSAFTQGRLSGGRGFVGGLYGEGAARFDGWLITMGLRADEWSTTHGHLIQTTLATGIVTLDQQYTRRSGVVPTARAGLRRELGDGLYLRSAGYGGFRAPSLNELYRPFRLGNNVTLANAALTPEKLYGGEVGVGGEEGAFSWDATAFWNRLHNAITNVTLPHPSTPVPGFGVIPAGGSLIQRQNAGDIDGTGIEAEGHYRLSDAVTLNAAFDVVDAHVDGGIQAPQLTGKRPAQAPRWTVTAGVQAAPMDRLSLSAHVRYESARFADDQNTLPLASAASVDAKASYALTSQLAVYVAADNLFDARIATTESADGTINYGAPRIVRAGLSFAQ
jgi:outer membrane receptor protein involved in Fe transport